MHSHALRFFVLVLVAGLMSLPVLADRQGTSTADHTKFEVLQGPFETGEDVTRACLSCHTEAAQHIMETPHWTWDYEHPDTGQRLGKRTMINTFCIADESNEAFCQGCHIGYGWEDHTFDFEDENRVDCLACHNTGEYRKVLGLAGHPAYERTEYPPGSGVFHEPVDLVSVAQHVGRTSRETCGSCHFAGGGGDGVKHGDLDSSLIDPHRDLDVHMASDGLNFTCSDCHQTQNHAVPGSRISMSAAPDHGPMMRGLDNGANPASCQSCHGNEPHQGFTHAQRLNDHGQTLACQTCHIPEFSRGGVPTRMEWDWSVAGQMDEDGNPYIERDERGWITYDSRKGSFVNAENVVPEYRWFNGVIDYTTAEDQIDPSTLVELNRFLGTPGGADSRIWPVKTVHSRQPFDTVHMHLLKPQVAIPNDTSFWFNFDWDLALTAGTEAAGQPFSGDFDFADTLMLWPITHMVAPSESALDCAACHAENGRLEGVEGVWLPGRDRHQWLDRMGFGLAGLILLGALGHGGLRMAAAARNKNKEH